MEQAHIDLEGRELLVDDYKKSHTTLASFVQGFEGITPHNPFMMEKCPYCI